MSEPHVFTVSDLVGEMRLLMERSYPEIWIEGELSSLSKPASGHWYFSLKDDSSQLRCAMFKSRANLSRYLPKVGDLVRVRAKISVYPARGDLQCIVQHIEDAGLGVLQRRFDELKSKLAAEGLFNADQKSAIPKNAKHIGVITSPTGAAIKDVLSTLARRNPAAEVTVYPSVVQGEGASSYLIAALHAAERHAKAEVLIITRGGGSMEDLWCFNDEALARAVYACAIPVVSAVGHEVDVTITDFVADLRAPTPTAAAELISAEREILITDLMRSAKRFKDAFERVIQLRWQINDHTFNRLKHPREHIHRQGKTLEQLRDRINLAARSDLRNKSTHWRVTRNRLIRETPQHAINQNRRELTQQTEQLQNAMLRRLKGKQDKFTSCAEQLQLVSPLATLSRGFSITYAENGTIVRNSTDVRKGNTLQIALASGRLACEVVDVEEA